MLVTGSFLVGGYVKSPWEAAAENASEPVDVSTVVSERDFQSVPVQINGTLQLGQDLIVTAPALTYARDVVTSITESAGGIVNSGKAIGTVSGRPLLALALSLPMYRDLALGDSGPDVISVQQALTELGLYLGKADGNYGIGTAAAVKKLYLRAGATPPTATAGAAPEQTAAQPQTATTSAVKTTDQPGETPEPSASQAPPAPLGTPLPLAEVVTIPPGQVVVVSIAGVGSVLEPGSPFAILRSGYARVVARVGVGDADKYGADAVVSLAIVGISTAVEAKVIAVSEFLPADGTEKPAGYDVSIGFSSEVPDGAADGVAVVAVPQATGNAIHSLALPLTAVREDDLGTYVLRESDGSRVGVKIGLEDAGYAEVLDGSDLQSGDRVKIGPAGG